MKGTKHKFTYDGSAGNIRVDVFLSDALKTISRARITALIKDGCLTVDGEKVRPAFKISGGETIAFFEPLETKSEL